MSLLRVSGNRCLVDWVADLRMSMEAKRFSAMQIMVEYIQELPPKMEYQFRRELQEPMARVLDEHLAIMEALQQGDPNTVKAKIIKHIRMELKESLDAYYRRHIGDSTFCPQEYYAYH